MIKILSINNCTGCTACAAVCPKRCIEMKKDADGFMHPFVDSTQCIHCRLCEQRCPIINNHHSVTELPKAYAVISKDNQNRLSSSSGGFFSELCKEVICNHGFVYGATYNESFEVYHICVENEKDLSLIRGAKYSQSNLGNTFVDIKKKLDENNKILFSGTPCQVAGLKSYLNKEYDNLICVDFVCHGVPSPMAWNVYVKYRSKVDNEGRLPVSINLRSKETGWSKYNYCHVFEYENKRVVIPNNESLYMKLFVGDYINQTACADCKFKGYSRVSDFTLGDFWGIWDIDPTMDDDKGTSVVLVHSEKGKNLFDKIKDNLVVKEVSLEEASRQNPSMLVSSEAKENRNEILQIICEGNISECENLFEVKRLSTPQKLKNKLSNLIHKVRNHV